MRTVGKGSIAALFIVMCVVCSTDNHAPVILDIGADPDSVAPGEISHLWAEVDDEDGEEVTITWLCAQGCLSSITGETVTWTAPDDTGSYPINVVAEDEHGATAHGFVTITVRGGSAESRSPVSHATCNY